MDGGANVFTLDAAVPPGLFCAHPDDLGLGYVLIHDVTFLKVNKHDLPVVKKQSSLIKALNYEMSQKQVRVTTFRYFLSQIN